MQAGVAAARRSARQTAERAATPDRAAAAGPQHALRSPSLPPNCSTPLPIGWSARPSPREGCLQRPAERFPLLAAPSRTAALPQFVPTREGFLAFMVESKVVYDAFEDIARQAVQPECEPLVWGAAVGEARGRGRGRPRGRPRRPRAGSRAPSGALIRLTACMLLLRSPPPADAKLANTGLERGEALAKDIAYMQQQWGLQAHAPAAEGPGHTYAK